MTKSTAASLNLKAMQRFTLLTLLTLGLYLGCEAQAYAGIVGNYTSMGNVLCYIVSMIYGNVGRGLATIAIAVLGLGAMMGKISWGMALTVVVGVAIVFNSNNIMSDIVTASATGGFQSGC